MKTLLLLLLLSGLSYSQDLPESPKPKWLDKQSVTQLALVGSSLAYDGLSSQALAGWHRAERYEINPFVGHSRTKTSVYFGVAFAASIGSSYVLRKHPRLRWLGTSVITGSEIFLASRNYAWVKWEHQYTNACMMANGGLNAYQRCPR